jgi:hypothetical protein
MRQADLDPIDPQVLAALEAVDATLAGEPVDPEHAEFAELALLLASERPAISRPFTDSLDRAIQRRFAPVSNGQKRKPWARRPSMRRWWLWAPAGGLAAVLAAAVVIVVAWGSSRPTVLTAASSGAKVPSPSAARPSPTARTPALSGEALSSSAPSTAGGSAGAVPLQPPANGRKTIQGAQLALTTAPSRIDLVAQELFVVVGQVHGIVESSDVTATSGPGGYAQFQLSIPSSTLPQAMASLSSLRYATVASRTDTTQDVNDQYEADLRALADARALRTSLLRQLANAITQAQIDSLTARIHDAEASISSDEATLRGLNRQIDYSQVGVTINGGVEPPLPVHSGGGGFGIGKAAHDAGRVLTVAAGIVLIAGAALVPVALLGALAWWIAATVRRRRREQALDLV